MAVLVSDWHCHRRVEEWDDVIQLLEKLDPPEAEDDAVWWILEDTHTSISLTCVWIFHHFNIFCSAAVAEKKGGQCGGVHLSLSNPDLGGHDHQTTLSHCDRDHYPDSVSLTKELRPEPTLQL